MLKKKNIFNNTQKGIHVDTGVEVAIKLEHVSIDPSFLRQEVSIYRSLSGCTGIPRVYLHYTECEYNALVFNLLGPNLEDLFNYCGRIFSLKTVLMLADQLLCRLQVLHDHDIIHRDIKPENCLMGVGKLGNVVYVTDLGLAVDYVDISCRDANFERPEHPRLIGTVQFASINGHLSSCEFVVSCVPYLFFPF